MGAVPVSALGLVLLLGLALGAAPAAAEPAAGLRVVTYNLLHGGPASGLTGDGQALETRLAAVMRELATLAPDIVGLQESSITRGRGNVAARLAERLGLYWTHASATRRVTRLRVLDSLLVWLVNFEEGPAILSRYPIVDVETVDLPRCRKLYDPRVLLRATLDTPVGRLKVFSTHTGHDACQVRRVAEIVGAVRGPLPAIVMGDFNASPATEWMESLVREHGLVDVYGAVNPAASGATVWQRVDAQAPTVSRRVDFIFVAPGTAAQTQVRESRVVLDTPIRRPDGALLWLSDHYGVFARLTIIPSRTVRR